MKLARVALAALLLAACAGAVCAKVRYARNIHTAAQQFDSGFSHRARLADRTAVTLAVMHGATRAHKLAAPA